MTEYSFTDPHGYQVLIGTAAGSKSEAFISARFGACVPAAEAPAAARAVLTNADCDDVIVVEGVGPLPEVTTDEDGDRRVEQGDDRRWATREATTQGLRDRAACAIALLLDRLAAEAARKPVLRDDVRVVLRRCVFEAALDADAAQVADAIAVGLAAIPDLTITEGSR